jgi:integrase
MTARALHSVPVAQVSLGDAVAAYLATLDHPESKGTRKQYGSIMGRLTASLGADHDVAGVTGEDLAGWMRETFGKRAPATWNLARVTLRSAWKFMGECGWADAGEAASIAPRKVAADRDRAIPRDALARLLADGKVPLRERALWTMLYETAARLSEILRLDVQDLDLAGHRATVTRKAGAADVVVWRAGTAGLLAQMLKGRTEGPVFVTSAKASAGIAVRDLAPDGKARLSARQAQHVFQHATAGLPGGWYTLHQLRHSALSQAADEGASTPMMMALSGHSSVKSLTRYARVSPDALARWQAERDPDRRR